MSDAPPEFPPGLDVTVITGMSGAGRSTAANALEDHGWYVVENLPPQMLTTLTELVARTPQSIPKLAVVVDVRGKELFNDIKASLDALRAAYNRLSADQVRAIAQRYDARCFVTQSDYPFELLHREGDVHVYALPSA